MARAVPRDWTLGTLRIAIFREGLAEEPEIFVPVSIRSGEPDSMHVINHAGERVNRLGIHDLSECENEGLSLKVNLLFFAFSHSLSLSLSLSQPYSH